MTIFLYARVSKDEARLTCNSGCLASNGDPYSWVPETRTDDTVCPRCGLAVTVNPKNSIWTQREALEAWARAKFPGAKLAYTWEVETSTIPWRARKAASEICRMAKKGDHVAVYRADRGWRNLQHFLNDTEDLRKRGITFHILQPDLTLDGSTQSQLVATMLMIGAQMERDMISERTKDALKIRRERGLATNWQPPLGSAHISGTDGRLIVVEDPDEQEKMLAVIEAKKSRTWAEMFVWASAMGITNRHGTPFRLGGLREFYFQSLKMQREGRLPVRL